MNVSAIGRVILAVFLIVVTPVGVALRYGASPPPATAGTVALAILALVLGVTGGLLLVRTTVLPQRVRDLFGRSDPTETAEADGKAPHGNTTRPMTGDLVRFLAGYLIGAFLLLSSVTWTLWNAQPREIGEVSFPAPVVRAPGAVPPLTAVRLHPDTLVYGLGRPAVRVIGSGFTPTSDVLIDGLPHPGARFVAENQMVVELGDADFRQAGTRAVSVSTGPLRSAPLPLFIQSGSAAVVAWSLPLMDPVPVSVEGRLILLVLLMGALGGTLASFNSLASYRGEGKLVRSWFLHYFLSPFLGGGVSLFLYFVVRAGFLSGTNVQMDANTTPWGLVAISGLAGLFYDKTLLKLREVFITLFDPKDDRGGKLDEPGEAAVEGLGIVTEKLPHATKGLSYRAQLEATGGKPAYSWRASPELPGGLRLDPLTGVISGVPTEESGKLTYEFSVSDLERNSAKIGLEFEVR